MRSLLLAMLSMSCACACDESQRVADTRAPVAPAAPAAARREPASAPPATRSEPSPTTAVAAIDPREATRRAAHDVLAEHCGECHESHRTTAKPKALAIFDLDQPDWPARFDEHKYKTALMRLARTSDAARDAFIAFRDAELAASPAKPN